VRKENGKSELFPFRESKYYYYYYYYYYVSYSYYFSTLHPKVEAVASIFVYFILAGTEDYLRVGGEKETL
jgi:hypothetical protein